MKPTGKAPAWKRANWLTRVQDCAFLLGVHGFLSEAERRRVQRRILRWLRTHHSDAEFTSVRGP